MASGLVFGEHLGASELSHGVQRSDPLNALEEAVLPALERPPCFVSFSGGRDSSAVLAVATRVAVREGLPAPIPITLRFPDFPESDESDWQDLVIQALGLTDWHRLVVRDELDVLGPTSQRVLRRHGVLWPANTHFHVPMLEKASGGVLLTGFDGDVLFGDWRWARAATVFSRETRPAPRDLLRVAFAACPGTVQRRVERRRDRLTLPWLRPRAQRAVEYAYADETVGQPIAWSKRVRWWARRRYLAVACESSKLVADEAGTAIGHPLLDPKFLAELASHTRSADFRNRTAAMRTLFGGLLPDSVLSRRDKAILPFWGPWSRDFASRWQGTGVSKELVDVEVLKRIWENDDDRDFRASSALQAAWLASTTDEIYPAS